MARTLMRSFAGGEITPEMYGRLDLTKYQTGLALCSNFRILPHGPAERRPGFKFRGEVKTSSKRTRLIPFAFSATQTAILEFGDQYFRVWINGDALLEASKPIVAIVGSTVQVTGHGWNTGDDVYIGSRFHRITYATADAFTTADLWGNPTVASGTTAARVLTVSTPIPEDDLREFNYAQDADVLTVVHPTLTAREVRRVSATNWTLTNVSFAAGISAPATISVVATVGTAGNQNPQTYCVTAVAADGVSESVASATVSTSNNLTVSGNYNTVSWGAVTGASRYRVYKQRGGSFGYIGSTTSLSIVDDNVLADTLITPPESLITLNTGADDYPGAVCHYEQRRWFAATNDKPQTIWATRTGTDSNLTSSLPSQDDDAMEFKIAARQQNAIRHLVPLADLLALTVGGEFRIFADSAPAIGPSSLSIKPQGYSGAAAVQPALTSGAVLYVQSQGSRIREMAYNWQNSAYVSIDISIMAPHLFDGYEVVELAFTRSPVPCLWAVRSDGALLGMTYVPEQQVYAWHRHDTDGLFESIAVVAEGGEDALYAVVQRTVDGRSVRYIERLSTSTFTDQADAFYVDCGLTYSGSPTSTLSGLWHLEGMEVQILADGAVHPNRTVVSGSITLQDAYSVVHVGLAYTSDIKTLPVALDGMPAGGAGATKNINGVAMRVTKASLVQAGPTFSRLTKFPARAVTDDYGSPPALRSQEVRFAIGASWNSDGAVCVRQDQPLPLTVLSIAPDVVVGG